MDTPSTSVDLRRVGAHPDHWYPVALSRDLKPGKSLEASFAGASIALARSEAGAIFALENRCAHRQVPLTQGLVSGETIRCGYHGWSFDKTGRCVEVPHLDHGGAGVRPYPVRERYGLVWLFPGKPELAEQRAIPEVPECGDAAYKTRYLSRRIACHYSFLHENLMDMNHQFLHRSLMGSIKPVLLDWKRGKEWIEASYRFERTAGKQSLGEKFMIGPKADSSAALREHDVMTIRTEYPHQRLTFTRADRERPALSLWITYVPVDKEQRSNHSFALMNIERPRIPGLINVFWPFIAWFTDGILGQDQRIVELEQKAWDAQGRDMNNELFPLIRQLRELLASNGVPN